MSDALQKGLLTQTAGLMEVLRQAAKMDHATVMQREASKAFSEYFDLYQAGAIFEQN